MDEGEGSRLGEISYVGRHTDAQPYPQSGLQEESRAMKATQQAWTALCGGGEIHPAAIPSVPFLVEVMGISVPATQDGILDILAAMARKGGEPKAAVGEELERIKPFARGGDEIVAAKTTDLLALF